MTDQKRGGKTKYRLPQSWRRAVAVLLLLTVLISGICTRYFSFVSRTFYQESTSHLSEILHKSDNMLNHLVSRNRMLLHLWSDFLDNASSEEQIRSSLNEMKGNRKYKRSSCSKRNRSYRCKIFNRSSKFFKL